MILWLGMILMCVSCSVHAAEWEAVQGDIVSLSYEGSVSDVSALGQHWPVRQHDGYTQAWLGVDLQQKPGDYSVIWHTAAGDVRDVLHVQAGHFRVSRITVPKTMSNFDAAAIRRIRNDQAAIRATYDVALPFSADFSHIVLPVHGIESTPFGAQRYVNGAPRAPHAGIDIAAPQGTAVLAAMRGKVLLAEPMLLNGNLIALGHGSGLVSVYAHLSHFDVQAGDQVEAGQKIGEVGSTGRSTGAHLHWGVYFQHARVNPDALLQLAGIHHIAPQK